jgi:hypothetical protein
MKEMKKMKENEENEENERNEGNERNEENEGNEGNGRTVPVVRHGHVLCRYNFERSCPFDNPVQEAVLKVDLTTKNTRKPQRSQGLYR